MLACVTRSHTGHRTQFSIQNTLLGADGGFEIALACDMVVVETSARFGLPAACRGPVEAGGQIGRTLDL